MSTFRGFPVVPCPSAKVHQVPQIRGLDVIQSIDNVKLTHHRGKLVEDIPWPDGLRTRIRVPSEEKRTELKLQAQLSFVNETWSTLRMTLREDQQKPELIAGRVSAIADEYFRDWVQSHNRSIHSNRTFLDRFK